MVVFMALAAQILWTVRNASSVIRFDEKENVSSINNAKNSLQKQVRVKAVETYPTVERYIDCILPKKEPLKQVKCHEHIDIFADSQGDVLFFRQRDGPIFPSLRLLHRYPFMLPHMQVDKGAIKFVLNGSHIMCPGLTSKGGRMTNLPPGSVVAVVAEGKRHALAVGLTSLSSEDMMLRFRRCVLLILIIWLVGAVLLILFIPSSGGGRSRFGLTKHESDARRKQLAVLIPFRDRFYELSIFLPYMRQYLRSQDIKHHFFVIHQVDGYRFNRAALVNVGFRETSKKFDYLVIHDVDLLPVNPNISYSYPLRGPIHLTPPELHPKYHYKKFLGGILLLTREQFQAAGGMSNLFWGWGREDDEFRLRLLEAGMQISRPHGVKTGYKTFNHIHNPQQHPRDYALTHNQRQVTFRRDVVTGVETVQYHIDRQYPLMVQSVSATVFDVLLKCDKDWTPYCEYPT